MQTSAHHIRIIRVVAAIGLILTLAVPPVAWAKNVPGNNGTVKIHDGAGESSPITQNDPHVGCAFHLHFLFGDDDQTGTWEIRSWSPTGDGTQVASGSYDATGDGEDREDVTFTSSGHFKLFWAGDTDKHAKQKVFWVDCEDGGNQSPDQ